MKRKGFHWCLCLAMLVWMTPIVVVANESADDIISMMQWWDSYGQYWEEIGADPSVEDDINFAQVDQQGLAPSTELTGGTVQ